MDIKALKQSSKSALKGKWGIAIGALMIYGLVESIVNPTTSTNTMMLDDFVYSTFLGLGMLITIPLQVGVDWLFLDIYDGKEVKLKQIFEGFKCYLKILAISLLMGLFIVLGLVLFLVPGVIIAINYSQAIFILRENPELGIREIMRESRRLMNGYKGRYFALSLQLIGWLLIPATSYVLAMLLLFGGISILSTLILLIITIISSIGGILYIIPYYYTIFAGFYRELPNKR